MTSFDSLSQYVSNYGMRVKKYSDRQGSDFREIPYEWRYDIRIETLFEELKKVSITINKIRSKFDLKSIPSKFKENQEFLKHENWLSEQKSIYPDGIIAYTIKNEDFLFLAHFQDKKSFLEQIDDILESKGISNEDRIYFK